MTINNFKYSSFLIPLLDGRIYVAQRGTEPHKGSYGAIGGKSEPQKAESERLRLVQTAGEHLKISFSDLHAKSQGREFTLDTAIREFCEEAFSTLNYPSDFKEGDFTDAVSLGWIGDRIEPFPAFINQFYIGKVNRKDFSFSQREIKDFKPLQEISGNQIFPITQAALIQLRYLLSNEKHFTSIPELLPYKSMDLLKQIPDIRLDKIRPTDMHGVFAKYLEDQLF